jgi:invasion protein IalB
MSLGTTPRLRGSIAAATALALGAFLAPGLAEAQQQPQRQQRPAAQQPAQPQAQQPAPAAQPASPALPGQQQGAGAPGPMVIQVKADPAQTDWIKTCGKDEGAKAEICATTRDFVSDQGQPALAVAVYDVKGPQPQRVVRFLLPPGFLLQPGIRFAVDQNAPTPGRYAICMPNGCFAEALATKDDVIGQFKKGTNLNVSLQNPVGQEVTFQVPLAGFAKAFDGPAVDPKVLEEQQKRLQDELQKRSEELRKKLEQSATTPR